MLDMIEIQQKPEDIARQRAEVARLFILKSANINNGNITSLSANDIKLLFDLYDQVFFAGWFQDCFKGRLKFSLSRRMTRSAALTFCPKNIADIKPEELVLEIRIGVDFLFHYDWGEGIKSVGGLKTNNSLEALQLVLEHEICHVIEFIHFQDSNCSRPRFKTIARNLFGHTQSYHQLPTNREIAEQKLGLSIGDTVAFTYEGKNMQGVLHNINKRATVMVRDRKGSYADSQGNRYAKYYVPLKLLKRVAVKSPNDRLKS